MKKFQFPMMIIVILTIGFANKSNAQKQSKGLYLTSNDYLNRVLSYKTDADNPNKPDINIHEFIGRNTITVTSNDKKKVLVKNEVFGYHADNHDYRFYDNIIYRIVDTTGFFLYSTEKLVQQGKGPKPTTFYYFSKKAGDQILPLTPEYIAKEYPQNYKLKYMVEVASKQTLTWMPTISIRTCIRSRNCTPKA